MGGELVGLPPFNPEPKITQNQLFWEAFPAYLVMGMSSDEYWDGEAQMCVAYRKAYKERLEMQDAMLWRQGLYFYHALGCTAPLFNSIKPRKAFDYIKPFGFEQKKKEEPKAVDAGLAFVRAWADRVNAKRQQNGG